MFQRPRTVSAKPRTFHHRLPSSLLDPLVPSRYGILKYALDFLTCLNHNELLFGNRILTVMVYPKLFLDPLAWLLA